VPPQGLGEASTRTSVATRSLRRQGAYLNSECKQEQQQAKAPEPAALGMAAQLVSATSGPTAASPAAAEEADCFNALPAQIQQPSKSMPALLAMDCPSDQLCAGQFSGGPSAPRLGPQQ
jgi:hypothetical protein